MENKRTLKLLGVFFIVIALIMPALSFVGDENLLEKASIHITSETDFVADPGAPITVNFCYHNGWSTSTVSFAATCYDGENNVVKTIPKEYVGDPGSETHYSYSFNAPSDPGEYNAKIEYEIWLIKEDGTMMNREDVEDIPFTVRGTAPPLMHTLTVIVNDINGTLIHGADVSTQSGIFGTTRTGGVLSKEMEAGTYLVSATKSGYSSASESVNLDQDKSVSLILEIGPFPIDESTPSSLSNMSEDDLLYPQSSVGDLSGTYTLNIAFKAEDGTPISNVKVMIGSVEYKSDINGKVTVDIEKDDIVNVIATKEGFNRFQKEIEMNTNKEIKVEMVPSKGGFFLDLGFEGMSENPFYDPEGIGGQVPIPVVVGSFISLGLGLFLVTRP